MTRRLDLLRNMMLSWPTLRITFPRGGMGRHILVEMTKEISGAQLEMSTTNGCNAGIDQQVAHKAEESSTTRS